MNRTSMLAIVTFILLINGCAADPLLTSRVDSLPDPVAPYREMIDKGAHVDFDQGAIIGFKEGRPHVKDRLPLAIAADHGDLMLLNGYLQLALHFPDSKMKIQVAGHADPHECKPAACIELSKRRALLMRDLLISKGVAAEFIARTCWYGSDYVLTPESTEKERSRNRRVEIYYDDYPSLKGRCSIDGF